MALSHKEIVFTVNAKVDQVYLAICHAAAAIKGFRDKRREDASRKVFMRTGVTLLSWGESILIQVSEEAGNAQIKIQSHSDFSIGGFLHNKQNVDKIYAALYPVLQELSVVKQENIVDGIWICNCGQQNSENFCSACGQARP